MATAYGIVLTEDFAYKLGVSALFAKGNGYLKVDGKVTTSIKVVMYAVIETIKALEDYVDGLDASFFRAERDLHVTISSRGADPVGGESYGLPLAMAITAAMLRKEIPSDICFTGIITPSGEVATVEDIARKRTFAAALGFKKIVLPDTQLDYFNSEINQCPVNSLMAAIGGQFWE